MVSTRRVGRWAPRGHRARSSLAALLSAPSPSGPRGAGLLAGSVSPIFCCFSYSWRAFSGGETESTGLGRRQSPLWGEQGAAEPEAPQVPGALSPQAGVHQVCTDTAFVIVGMGRLNGREGQVDRLIHTHHGTRPPRRVQGRTCCSVQGHSGGLSESCVSGEVCTYKASGRFFPAGAGEHPEAPPSPGRCSPQVGLSLQQEEAEFHSSI